jgi:SET domain-containing protein
MKIDYGTLSFINQGLEVKTSNIEHAGMGLFARKLFKKGDIITEYDGDDITKEDAHMLINEYGIIRCSHMRSYSNQGAQIVIDGLREPINGRGGGSFINHKPKQHCNCVFWEPSRNIFYKLNTETRTKLVLNRVFIRARQDIHINDELYIHYGKYNNCAQLCHV